MTDGIIYAQFSPVARVVDPEGASKLMTIIIHYLKKLRVAVIVT